MKGTCATLVLLGLAFLVLQAGCKPPAAPATGTPATQPPAAIASETPQQTEAGSWTLTSSAFLNEERIPAEYTQDGEGLSPPLSWTAPPEAAQELVLICDDPDAPSGTFTHWVLYGLDPQVKELPEGITTTPVVATPDLKQGMNSAHRVGYAGPAPPPGKVHHYHFTLYAAGAELNLTPSLGKQDVLKAMEGQILAQTEIVGAYSR